MEPAAAEEAAEEKARKAAGGGATISRTSSGVGYGGSRNRALGSSDAVRSEEEMMAVIAQLEAAEKREKTPEWIAKQCARPTPMLLEPMLSATPRFLSRANLVDDAKVEERERLRNVVWTPRERKVFVEKFILYPKNFRKIKGFLELKSVGDCVQFYYREKHELELKKGARSNRVAVRIRRGHRT